MILVDLSSEKNPITVITYGTFDMFHIGHLNLLRNLKSLGDRLIVGVSTDEFNAQKGKRTLIPYEQRVEIVGAIRYVDKTFPENFWDQKRNDIIREKAKIFAMGSDWVGKFDDLNDICEVLYFPRTDFICSSDVKKLISSLINNEKESQ